MDKIAARPKKLGDGTWGAWTSNTETKEGDMVTITTSTGSSWDATVTKVIHSSEKGCILQTRGVDRKKSKPTESTVRRDDLAEDDENWF